MLHESDAAGVVAPKRQLTLFDSTCIIVGIIIGSAVYESTPAIAGGVPSAWGLALVWAAGGLVSLVGALCYAELATAYPADGGDYVYLRRAFGRPMGFLFAWAQLWVVRPGSIGAMAFVFARYANELAPLKAGGLELMIYAAGAVIVLTIVNVLGVRQGKWTQNALTAAKVVGLLAVVVVGLTYSSRPANPPPLEPVSGFGFYLALILIFYAYGGWNEMAYVAAEVRDPRKNILRSLIVGTVAVMLIYVLVNIAFVHALGFGGVRGSRAVAADVLRLGAGPWGGRAISALICVSALGAINGLIFTGARITYAMGQDYRLYAWLGRWNPRFGTPAWSLLVQAVVTLALVAGFGRTEKGFQNLVNFTTPVFWIFFLLVGVSLFVLRYVDRHTNRPYRVPLYPLVPALFCASSAFMVYASLSFAYAVRTMEALWSVGILAAGVGLCFFDRKPPAERAA